MMLIPNTSLKRSTLNTITIKNNSKLDTKKYTVWVAGYIQQIKNKKPEYLALQSNGSFALSSSGTATFINVNAGMTVNVPNVTNYGNNRLVFTVTDASVSQPNALSPIKGYTSYPFSGKPGVCPPGPYDIFEFGPNAQYDVSAVDSFGLNLSFTVKGDNLTYGTNALVSRAQISKAYTDFVTNDPLGNTGFKNLLYTSKTGSGYPDVIDGQFSAIVSPKDWLAIHPNATGLKDYWKDTIDAFFKSGNQINLYLNAATVGNYSGSSDGSKYTLTGPGSLSIIIPASDFKAPNQGFIQAVRDKSSGESNQKYAAFGQIEAAIFEAMSRGVLLDGVIASSSTTTITNNYTSDAWTNVSNWYTNHNNTYNKNPSVYDVYAKFLHYATVNLSGTSTSIFGENKNKSFGMAYGFSLDESPNVSDNWSVNDNVPSKPVYTIGSGQDVTLSLGLWS